MLLIIEITEYKHDFQEIKICDNWAYQWSYFSNMARPVPLSLHIRPVIGFNICKRTDSHETEDLGK